VNTIITGFFKNPCRDTAFLFLSSGFKIEISGFAFCCLNLKPSTLIYSPAADLFLNLVKNDK